MSYIKDSSFSNVINIIREYFKKIKKYTDDKLKLKTDQIYTDEKLKLKADQTYVDSNFSSIRTSIGSLTGTPEYVDKILLKSGGTMTGDLMLNKNPQSDMQASTKKYVDDKVSESVPLSGGTMTGKLNLSGDPTEDKQAATKHYVDSKEPPVATTTTAGVVKVGDGLSVTSDGTLNGGLSTATKNYVDNSESYKIGDVITTARTNLGNNWVLCNGDQVYKSEYPEAYEVLNRGDYYLYNTYKEDDYSSSDISNDYCFLVGDFLIFSQKYNGGTNWRKINIKTGEVLKGNIGATCFTPLVYFNGLYMAARCAENPQSLEDYISLYYTDDLGKNFTSKYIGDIDVTPSYQGMPYIYNTFYYDGTHYFIVGHIGTLYTTPDKIDSWNKSDFSFGSIFSAYYVDGYSFFLGASASNTSSGTRLHYIKGAPLSEVSTHEILNDTHYRIKLLGIYHFDVWHIVLYDSQRKKIYEKSGTELSNLTDYIIKENAADSFVFYADEQNISFLEDRKQLLRYNFNSHLTTAIAVLENTNNAPFFTALSTNAETPYLYVSAGYSSPIKIYRTAPAYLPTISTDGAHNYIKVDGD